ncbi:MAG: TRAP transporter substrate-binding protein DctP [bacterium]|nr:TRAP transporter substrate-binding protein DctP [bacterium]
MKSINVQRYSGNACVRLLVTLFFVLIWLTPASYGKTLKMLSSWPETMVFVKGCVEPFNKNLAEISKGQIETRFLGPDVISAVEQFQPLQSGVFDMLFTISAYHLGTTAIGAAVDAVDPDPTKRREKGIFDVIDKHYQKLGVKVVAIIPITDLNFLTRNPIEGNTPSFNGLKLRTIKTVSPLVEALGGVPVNLPSGEVYTSLQKGVIDGAVVITFGIMDLKWHEVTRYLVRPTFGNISGYIFMNLNKFNSLSPQEQDMIVRTGIKSELDSVSYFQNKKSEEVKKLKALGMKETLLRPEDAKRINALFNDAIWSIVESKSGDEARQLRQFAISKGLTQ